MRYAMLALVLTAGLYSQTPPPRDPNQQTNAPVGLVPRQSDVKGAGLNLRPFPWEKQVQSPPYAKWKIFPSDPPVTRSAPVANLSLHDPKLGNFVPRKPVMRVQRMNQPSPCSIPLKSVPVPPTWPGGPTPEVRHVPMSNSLLPMTEAKLPAPPCEEK